MGWAAALFFSISSLRFTSPRFNPLEHVSVINIEDLERKKWKRKGLSLERKCFKMEYQCLVQTNYACVRVLIIVFVLLHPPPGLPISWQNANVSIEEVPPLLFLPSKKKLSSLRSNIKQKSCTSLADEHFHTPYTYEYEYDFFNRPLIILLIMSFHYFII